MGPNDRRREAGTDRTERGGNENDRTEDETAVGERDTDREFVNEELIPVLVVVGVILFLFPEPVTSALGVVLVGLGIALWVRELFRPG